MESLYQANKTYQKAFDKFYGLHKRSNKLKHYNKVKIIMYIVLCESAYISLSLGSMDIDI